MSETSRDDFWDITRAILMWLVILGHTIQAVAQGSFFSHPLFKAIYLFHIPVFFFISGYFALGSIRKRGWKGLGRTALRLMLPVLSMGTLQLILLACRQPVSPGKTLHCYVCLWFLWSLLECQIAGHLLMSLPHRAWRAIALVLPVITCILLRDYIPFADYISISWPFYALGMYARHKGFTHAQLSPRWFWTLIPAAAAFFLYRDDWYIYLAPLSFSAESFTIAIFRILAALASGTFFLALMHHHTALKCLAGFGRASLGIYVVQAVLCTVANRLNYPPVCSQVWVMLPLSLLVFLLSYSIYKLTRKLPYAGLLLYGDLTRHQGSEETVRMPQ